MEKIKLFLLKIKTFVLKIWNKVKTFVLKHWLSIVNWIVLILIYANTNQVGIETIVGLWIFIQIAYAGYKLFKKN